MTPMIRRLYASWISDHKYYFVAADANDDEWLREWAATRPSINWLKEKYVADVIDLDEFELMVGLRLRETVAICCVGSQAVLP